MMRLTTTKVLETVIVKKDLSREERLTHLAEKIGIDYDDIEYVIETLMPLLKIHNPRTAEIITLHYGIDDDNPQSAKELVKKYGFKRTALTRVYESGIVFLRRMYVEPEHRVFGLQLNRLTMGEFFSTQRVFKALHDLKAGRYQTAHNMSLTFAYLANNKKSGADYNFGDWLLAAKGNPNSLKEKLKKRKYEVLSRILNDEGISLNQNSKKLSA